jgi:sulfite exporter TauE/SafE
MALLGALALAGPVQGGLYMLLFGLGTVPMMSLVAFSKGMIKPTVVQGFKKLIPIFVVLIGLLFILRGLGLGIPYVSPQEVRPEMVTTQVECQ